MWAFGILLYWMLSGRTPFEATTISSIFVNIETGRWSFKGDCWQGVSDDAKVRSQALVLLVLLLLPATACPCMLHSFVRCVQA